MPEFRIRVAEQVAAVQCLFDSTPYFLGKYGTSDPSDFSITVTRADLEQERAFRHAEAAAEGFRPKNESDPFLERLVILRKFAAHLLSHDTLLLHGSAVAVDGVGYLFTARCGTGKSTHARLWRQVFGERAVAINDDKPFLRITPAGVFVCGSPWCGKHGLETNTQVPLGGICILERGRENKIRPANPCEIPFVHQQILVPYAPAMEKKSMGLASILTERVPVWHMDCNMDPSAAAVSYAAMCPNGAS